MLNQNEKNTASEFDAVNEKRITPLQLLQEVQPLLKEYFIGGFEICENAIKLSFKNGQNFKMTIGEVV